LRFEIVLAARRLEPSLEFLSVVEEDLSGKNDLEILKYARENDLILVSHDVNTMKATAEECIRSGKGTAGLFLVPQSRRTRPVSECLLMIRAASRAGEWRDRIVYLPF